MRGKVGSVPDKQLEVAEGASGPWTGADVRQVRSAVCVCVCVGRAQISSSSSGEHTRG